jgi:hypothetical protein
MEEFDGPRQLITTQMRKLQAMCKEIAGRSGTSHPEGFCADQHIRLSRRMVDLLPIDDHPLSGMRHVSADGVLPPHGLSSLTQGWLTSRRRRECRRRT